MSYGPSMRVPPVVSLAILLIAACKQAERRVAADAAADEPPFTRDVRLLCSAPSVGGGDIDKGTLAIQGRIRDPEVRALMMGMGGADPAQKAALLDDAVTRAGLARCELLEAWSAQ